MNIYCIFDDFDSKAIDIIEESGGHLTVHPSGIPRPNQCQMKEILEEYDGVIIGTSQQITDGMFDNINSPKVISTASVGLDHINVPHEKKHLIKIINTPKANARSVAEYTIGCALTCSKRFFESMDLYKAGKSNKDLFQKPEDLAGKTIGVIGAGTISVCIMEYALFFGMNVLCWTRNPEKHKELVKKGVRFVELDDLVVMADVISVNLPNNSDTKGLISSELIKKMKVTSIFISVSRLDTINMETLFEKAKEERGFYVCLDIDVNQKVIEKIPDQPNVLVTPHIAGGTTETRKRMFLEVASAFASIIGR